MYQSRLREYFYRDYFCSPFLEAIREIFRWRKFATYGIYSSSKQPFSVSQYEVCGETAPADEVCTLSVGDRESSVSMIKAVLFNTYQVY